MQANAVGTAYPFVYFTSVNNMEDGYALPSRHFFNYCRMPQSVASNSYFNFTPLHLHPALKTGRQAILKLTTNIRAAVRIPKQRVLSLFNILSLINILSLSSGIMFVKIFSLEKRIRTVCGMLVYDQKIKVLTNNINLRTRT